MKVYKTIDPKKLQELLANIQKDLQEWKVIEINLEEGQDANILHVARQMDGYFGIWDGAIFVCNDVKILILARLGTKTEVLKIKQGIVEKLPDYRFEINANAISAEGIRKIEIRLTDVAKLQRAMEEQSRYGLLKKRSLRQQKIFFVVDDDMFMRSLIAKALRPHGLVHVFEDGKALVDAYLKELPDVVFLDIHMPGESGIELLGEVMEYDATAGVIILSSDSVKENVLLAQARGAKGFVAKPFTKDKIEAIMKKCLEQADLLARMA